MKNISLKSVAISSVVCFILMFLFIVLLGMIYGALFADGRGREEVGMEFANSWISYLALAAPIFAGYLAAHIAKRRPVLHGALSATLNVLWGLYCLLFLGPVMVSGVLILIANPLLGMLGGYIWLTTHFDGEISDI